jgi:hypothetical protein
MNHIVRQIALVFLTGCTAWAQLNTSSVLPVPRSAHVIEAFPGKTTDYHGVAAYTVLFGREKAVVLCPDKPAEGRPWVLAPSLYDLTRPHARETVVCGPGQPWGSRARRCAVSRRPPGHGGNPPLDAGCPCRTHQSPARLGKRSHAGGSRSEISEQLVQHSCHPLSGRDVKNS